MIDFNKLTMGEIALIEKLGEQSISMIGEDDAPKGKSMAALAMVIKRRSGHPSFSWGDAQALSMDEVNELLGVEDDADEDADEDGDGETPTKD